MSTLTALVGALALSGAAAPDDNSPNLDDVADTNSNVNIVLPTDVSVTVFGRAQLDALFGSGDSPFDTVDEVGFRRARIGVKGEAGVFDYKAEYDFAGGDADFADLFLGWKNSPLGRAQVGHFKEPVGLEELTSSRFITFTERALTAAFTPSRNVGIMFSDSTDQVAWQYGVFGADTDSSGGGKIDGMYALSGRIVFPVVNDDNNQVHLGLSASVRSQDTVDYTTRSEVPFVSAVAGTGPLSNDGITLYGAEAAWVGGPWSVQGEYLAADVTDAATATSATEDATYGAWYVEGSYYLTGESRNYQQSRGVFGRPPVTEDFDGEGGMGAIQFAVRYSMLDLNDGPTTDELSDITLGMNWWLNDHTRVSANYVTSNYESGAVDEDADYLAVRFQFDF